MIGELETENKERWEALSAASTEAVGSPRPESVSTLMYNSETRTGTLTV